MTPRWRLFPKYALLIIALVGGMLIASGAISIYFSWRENQQNLIALQVEKAQAAATRIEQYILDLEHQLGWTALPAIDVGGSPLEQRRIEYLKLLRQAPAITEVAWLDATGHEQLRISRLAMDAVGAGIDFSTEPKFTAARQGETYYGPVYFRKETEPYMTIARPAGSGGGVTAAEVNLKFVWEVVSRIKIGEKGLAYVVDAGGTLIAHPDISLVLKKTDLKSLPQVAALTRPEGSAPVAARDVRGGPVLSAHAAIPTLRWTVFVESPEAEAFAPLYASIARASLLLGAGLLVSIVASFFVARALVRPLQALQEGAARIGAGELDRRIEVRTGDELEGLAEQFNKMASELKASYAGLERKVAERTAELTESLAQQTATAEILRVISGSIADSQPVFDAIVESCLHLFGGTRVVMVLPQGQTLTTAARAGVEAPGELKDLEAWPLDRDSAAGACILDARLIAVPDTEVGSHLFPRMRRLAIALGFGSGLFVPLLRDGRALGCLAILRVGTGDFAAKEVSLAQTFADQAVIAIENSRLFSETREALHKVELRTGELTEALEYQTAISAVLRVISESPTDVAPVFEAILGSTARLFGDPIAAMMRYDGQLVHLVATSNWTPEAIEDARRYYPGPPNPRMMSGRVLLTGRVEHVDDALLDPDYDHTTAQLGQWRRMIGAPLLKDGVAIGVIVVAWPDAGSTPQRQADLLKTFADQAVIAIENVRLINETKEALEQQTATSEILQVISGSVADAKPVFEKILQSCNHLFDSAEQGILLVGEDGRLLLGAHRGGAQARLAALLPLQRVGPLAPSIGENRVLQFKDVLHDPDVPAPIRAVAEQLGIGTYSQVFAPMLWEGRGIGSLYVTRQPPVGFTPKEVGLLKTFADQAVIAIQNARLFNETKEALEQQTATAEVLQVISSSVADARPVFDIILDSCERLFAATTLGIYLVDEAGMLRIGGFRGTDESQAAAAAAFPRPLEGTASAMAIRERRVVHFPDILADPASPAPLRRIAETVGNFSIAFAPMLWEERGVGAIQVSRDPPNPFTEKELSLLKTFADQAVIAIQNSRLFNEIQDKSRELEQANKHKSEFLANMSHELRTPLNAIIGFSEVLSEKMFGEVNEKQLEYLLDIHTSGHHLLTLINDILDLSKIEAGRMELELSRFDLGMLLDNSMTLVRERATRHGLTLTLDVADDLEDWVADQRKVKQIVINLLSNAVKFTPAGGRVTLRARRVGGADGGVEIAVIDTGMGIAEDQQALVFEEFRQASGDYLRKTEGTGLGLSLAKRFVELHGGTIRLESAPGRGSTFAFVLPQRALADAEAIQA